MSFRRFTVLAFVTTLVFGPAVAPKAVAQPMAEEDVPEPLKPWVSWVTERETTYGCTWLPSGPRCVWPGELRLTLDEKGGTFSQRVATDRETLVPLVGDRGAYPESVRVNGVATPIVEPEGNARPHVRIGAGTHTIDGELRFAELPELLRVPSEVARVVLVLDGARVPVPRRNEEGMLWLRARGASQDKEGHVELEVHRKLEDGLPFRVTTQILVRASGAPREIVLGGALLAGAVPTSIRADLAVRLLPDDKLAAQVRAGSYTIEVVGLLPSPPERLAREAGQAPWPDEEVWVWAASEAFRQVELRGAPAIDPARTSLPGDWRAFPAYLLRARDALSFETTRRGQPTPPPNQINLERDLWLDLEGGAYTVRDRLTGQMHEGFRLDLLHGDLGHVVLGGTDRLVTKSGKSTGVEIRETTFDLIAESRIAGDVRTLKAVGWSEDVQSLGATLRLPPGWSLLAAIGADDAGDTWIDRWDLWALFFVLLVSIAIGRLYGLPMGAVALATLVLTYHEPNAPRFTWVALVVFAALLRVLRTGAVARVVGALFFVSALVLVLFAVPFAADQVRSLLYPFTDAYETGSFDVFATQDKSAANVALQEATRMPAAAPATSADVPQPDMAAAQDAEGGGGEMPQRRAAERTKAEAFESTVTADGHARGDEWLDSMDGIEQGLMGLGGVTSKGYASKDRGGPLGQGWVDPNDVIQTGPGVPDWAFRAFRLSWSGPVAKDHTVELFLSPPWMHRAGALLRVLFLGLLLFVVVARRPRPKPRDPDVAKPQTAPRTAVAAAVAFGVVTAFLSSPAHAQDEPSNERLAELRARLTRSPDCAPNCVVASDMVVRVQGNRVSLDVIVHASARAAWRVPGPSDAWIPDVVRVGEAESTALALLDERFLFLRLEPGQHRVRLEGPIPNEDALTLAFGDPPRHVTVDAPGWDVEGVRTDGQVSQSMELRRRIRETERDRLDVQQLPSWLMVRRRLDIGVRWTIVTTVERITPAGVPVVVRVPLLKGESVTEADVLTERGSVVVTLGRDDTATTWTSVLDPRPTLTLSAAKGVRFSEAWTLSCSPIWHCDTEGLPPVEHARDGRSEPLFRPFPGEKLVVKLKRPDPAPGASTTIDRATLTLTPGVRMSSAVLELTARTSSGGALSLGLPSGAKVRALTVGGEARPVQHRKGALRITLAPGAQIVRVEWQEKEGMAARFEAPKVTLDKSAVNARVEIIMPPDRWLLFADGPEWGVAILFWPYLLLVLGLAFLLARSRQTPLRLVDWALLGAGLTQIDAWASLVVVGWFFLMAYRRRSVDLGVYTFDARQIGLVLYTLLALGCLYAAVHVGLLMQPDMQVVSTSGSDHMLSFYVDRIAREMPRPWVLSLPLWTFRVLMLFWALWLAFRLIGWARWGWSSFTTGGGWKKPPPAPFVRRPAAPATSPLPQGVASQQAAPTAPITQPPLSAATSKEPRPSPSGAGTNDPKPAPGRYAEDEGGDPSRET